MDLICSKCGQSRDKGRKICKSCNLERVRNYQNDKNRAGKRKKYDVVCLACSKQYQSFRNKPVLCEECRLLKNKGNDVTNTYLYYGDKKYFHLHRKVAEQCIDRKLKTNEVVHHINCKNLDNRIENLIILTRSTHSKLHRYLDTQRVIIEKSINENPGNCWDNLIAPMTTAWLEMTGAKVIKLWEIGQSAAESLKE